MVGKLLLLLGFRSRRKTTTRASDTQDLLCVNPIASDYEDLITFVENQRFLRKESSIAGDNVLFLSHCWCNTEVQLVKRQVIAMLGLSGMTYWSDFLDLKALAPMPWHWKIADGIRETAKVILLVDKEWLLSINCIREFAYAEAHNKPVVVVVLEQEAMDLVESPNGAEQAWSMTPMHGRPLNAFNGQILTPQMGDGC
eukprot:7584755-Pyramimonas_sp.AAC.1